MPRPLTPEWVRRVCDRHRGLGADGILVREPGSSHRVRIFNPDGSEAEKSGNGLRIFARYLWDAIRDEWRERVTNVAAQVDPRSGLFEQLRPRFSVAPRIEIMVPVRSPVSIDERAPVYLWR